MVAKPYPAKAARGETRKAGGQPGNLNRAKNVVSALKRVQQGKPLPANLTRITALAEQEASALVSDRGGWEYMSGAEQLMIGVWRSARQSELLIWHEVIERTAIQVDESGAWDLQPGLQRLAPFLAAQHRALVALGLERRQRPVSDLQTYLREHYREDPEGKTDGEDKAEEKGKESSTS